MPNTAVLAHTYAALSRAAARKRIYAARAQQAGRVDVARLLSALASSEETQGRRLFNTFRGAVDTSEHSLATIFTDELAEVLAEYEEQLESARKSGNAGLEQTLSQLFQAEQRLHSFFDPKSGEVTIDCANEFFACPFCGYLASATAPGKCPICGTAGKSFRPAE